VKTNFEAPFLYLLFGKDRVLLLDTGAGGLKIRPTVDAAIDQWLAEHHRVSIPLVVAHTHSHGDHRMGDAEFKDRPDTVVVGWTAPEVAAFSRSPTGRATSAKFDLGGRVSTSSRRPGHHPSHIMIFDERTRWLLSGDTPLSRPPLHPRRRLRRLPRQHRPGGRLHESARVSHVMGAHIEMTREPGKDYRDAAPTHPNEHALELPYADLPGVAGGRPRHGRHGQARRPSGFHRLPACRPRPKP
jgi:glyoxylase-like metal-dependent hydrolase (beta-lactamase superfamily II)